MNALLLNPPVQEPVSLAETRAWLRLDTKDEDEILLALIGAARRWCEAFLRRVLVAQDWRVCVDAWPDMGIDLPVSPVRAVQALRLRDAEGGWAPLDPACCRLEEEAGRQRLVLKGAPAAPHGVEIDLAAGYGQPAQVPAPIRQAMLVLIAHLHAHRGDDDAAPPASVSLLLAPYRLARVA